MKLDYGTFTIKGGKGTLINDVTQELGICFFDPKYIVVSKSTILRDVGGGGVGGGGRSCSVATLHAPIHTVLPFSWEHFIIL